MRTHAAYIGRHELNGEIALPQGARGLVIFAHGSGSGRHSPRNHQVASDLQAHGLATLLFDLLTESEAQSRASVFDITLLGLRLCEAIDWAAATPSCRDLPIGLFGASTGAAAALVAAAQRPRRVNAVVSRGGRADLAGPQLERVVAPTLLVVGALDTEVLRLNEAALARMHCVRRLETIAGASHLFEEPGTLEQVSELAAGWFRRYLEAAAAA